MGAYPSSIPPLSLLRQPTQLLENVAKVSFYCLPIDFATGSVSDSRNYCGF